MSDDIINLNLNDPSSALPEGSWIRKYMKLASILEAPPNLHFWAGVWAMSAALGRNVWFDQIAFKWYPSMYIIIVAPPGVIGKSVLGGVAQGLLKEADVVHFGPDKITAAALLEDLNEALKATNSGDPLDQQSNVAYFSSELANLLNAENDEMMHQLIDLWDGRDDFRKKTVKYGDVTISAPYVSILGMTTPTGLASAFAHEAKSNGFISRCIFQTADRKHTYNAYLKNVKGAAQTYTALRTDLIAHIKKISTAYGSFTMTADAEAWGTQWYKDYWEEYSKRQVGNLEQGAVARRQAMVHKLAMILAMSEDHTKRVITLRHMVIAAALVEPQAGLLQQVFLKGTRNADAELARTSVLQFLEGGRKRYAEVAQYIYMLYPSFRDLADFLSGLVNTGQIQLLQKGPNEVFLQLPPRV